MFRLVHQIDLYMLVMGAVSGKNVSYTVSKLTELKVKMAVKMAA